MKDQKYYLALDDYERAIILNSLFAKRSDLISEGKHTDAVDELIITFANAKKKKFKINGSVKLK